MACLATFRHAEVADLPMILRTERKYIQDIEPASLAAWTNAIDRNLALWIANLDRTVVAEVRDQAAGYAMWTAEGRASTLITICVLDDHRRRGIGGQLLERFASHAHGHGATVLRLGVHVTNPARGLYERAGYVRSGTDGDYLLFERQLSG